MARGGARGPSGRRWPSRLQLRQAGAPLTHVTPAKAGVHSDSVWIPAFAGMTRIGKPVQRPYTPPMERLDGGSAVPAHLRGGIAALRSEEHTSELQSLMRISYAVFCLKQKKQQTRESYDDTIHT